MNIKQSYLLILVLSMSLAGCAVVEVGKKIWGSSTQALEEARVDGIGQSFACGIDECFDAVLVLERQEPAKRTYQKIKMDGSYEKTKDEEELEEGEEDTSKEDVPPPVGYFDIFIQDRIKSHIVVMGVEGSVDTTEVGIFFTPEGSGSVRVEVSSLSSSAKRKIADIIFGKLAQQFPLKE